MINKIIATVLSLVASLFFSLPLKAGAIPTSEDTSSPLALKSPQLELMQSSPSPLVVNDEIVGMVAVYDDPATERPADCLKLYNNRGQLVAISWFDKFGIQRMAVDRGLLEDDGKLKGVFVLVLDGDSI